MTRNRSLAVVPLRGGFGNQLFGWAYGVALNERGTRVYFDRGNGLGRGFELDGLIQSNRLISLPTRVLWRLGREDRFKRLEKARLIFREDQSKPPQDFPEELGTLSFHWGYWQSLDYFEPVADKVAKDLLNWLPPGPQTLNEECALHVRRGDYVSDEAAAKTLGVLPLEYYSKAIEYMRSVGHTKFTVYTDDPDWARMHILTLDTDMQLSTETSALGDFLAMSRSGGLITANSSFSWWAGFLVSFLGGNIVAPEPWFSDPLIDSSRLVPPLWHRTSWT